MTMLEKFEEKAKKMPLPKVIQVSTNSQLALTLNESSPLALTLNWQQVLAKISEALIAGNAIEVLNLLFADLNYIQLHRNAVNDISNLVGQPVDKNMLIEAQVNILKKLIIEYLKHPQLNAPQLNSLTYESSFVVQQLKRLDIVGVGAFMLASGSYLALLQEQASLGEIEWSCFKKQAIKYSQYAASVTPKLFRLTVGQIDKACYCINWEAESQERITQYECHYFDGKDMHLFLAISPDAEMECNKHRLLMFQSVTDKVNQTAVQPVRTALKQWQKMAASL